MARDGRQTVKVRDLEGLIRHYKKELAKAHREIARLSKLLDKSMNESVNRDRNGDTERSWEPKSPKSERCEKCKEGVLTTISLRDAKGKNKTYLVCSAAKCGYRKIVNEP